MLSHTDLKKGVRFIFEGEPYEILESASLKKAQRRVVIQTKIRNLITGNVLDRNFHQGDTFEETEIEKLKVKFLYSHHDKYFFCLENNQAARFELPKEVIGQGIQFLKPNQIIEGIQFQGKIINISLPIKVQLKVIEAPPGLKGDRAQAGNKAVTLETGAKINAPLFIKEGDIVEVNTETGEYVKRAE